MGGGGAALDETTHRKAGKPKLVRHVSLAVQGLAWLAMAMVFNEFQSKSCEFVHSKINLIKSLFTNNPLLLDHKLQHLRHNNTGLKLPINRGSNNTHLA